MAITGEDAPRAPAGGAKERVSIWLIMVGVVVVLAGLLFGYDQGVIGGALEGIKARSASARA